MSRLGGTLASTILLALAFSSPASGADHLMRVTEVHPSTQNSALAFVELQDTAGESYPSLAYTLASFDASGRVIAEQRFNPPYGFARSTEPFLVGAMGVTPRDATLTIALADARKVCFYRGVGTTDQIDCMSFDAVPDGRSAQRTSSGGVVLACPTPDAPNRQTADGCTGAEPPAPGPTTPPVPMADGRAPVLTLAGKKTQRIGQLRVSAVADEQATLVMTGSVRVGGRNRAFAKLTRSVEAGAATTIRIRLSAANLRAVRRALGQGAKLTAKVRVAARDAAGNVTVTRRSISLRA